MTDSLDAITPDTFAMLRDLIAVLADPKRTHEKLVELEARIKDAKKSEQRAATLRERLSIDSARETALLDERKGELAKKARELALREAAVDAYEKQRVRDKIANVNYAGVVGGITREFVDGRQNGGKGSS